MALFQKPQQGQLSERQLLIQKFNAGRTDLLLVAILTLINIISMVASADGSYFVCSAIVPTFLLTFAGILCGKFPEEFYASENGTATPVEFVDNSLWIGAIVVSVIIALFYGLCWLLSKNMKKGWLVTGLVFYVLDTAFIFITFDVADAIIDIVFHAWVIWGIARGISACNKLAALPEEIPSFVEETPAYSQPETTLNGESLNNDTDNQNN